MPPNPTADDTLALIDALIGPGAAAAAPSSARHGGRLEALARRAARSAPPPPGEVLVPTADSSSEWTPRPGGASEVTDERRAAPNMGAPSTRIDHWDAYVCRFQADDDAPDRERL